MLLIFDLDGVLISSKELHYETLNLALMNVDSKYMIGRDEHLAKYDGLSTTKKLNMLTEEKGLPREKHNQVWKDKQAFTEDFLEHRIDYSPFLVDIFSELKKDGYKIAVASNAIRNTVKNSIHFLGLTKYVDLIVSNEDVKRPKPFPEIYWKAMADLNTLPRDTLIIEDSHHGRQGAVDSGAHLLAIENPEDLTWNKIRSALDKMEAIPRPNIPWRDGKLTVLIPMAGAGSRFSQAGYTFPKPLIDVEGKPMIQMVVDNLNIEPKRYVFIVQKDHYEKYDLGNVLKNICKDIPVEIVVVDGLTEGAACTTLIAQPYIDNDDPLLIANSDQWLDWNSNEVMYSLQSDTVDGGLLTFKSSHPKWSYAKLGENGFVEEVAEKRVISDNATCGIYYWRKGSDYVAYAHRMIDKNIRVNNEFYIAPVYNEAIQDGKRIKIKPVKGMSGTGVPEDLTAFLNRKKS